MRKDTCQGRPQKQENVPGSSMDPIWSNMGPIWAHMDQMCRVGPERKRKPFGNLYFSQQIMPIRILCVDDGM